MNDRVRTTIAAYDAGASFYVERDRRNPQGEMKRHFDRFAQFISGEGLVLDVGCGPGMHSLEFARRGYRVVSLDLSAGMLHEAAKRGIRNLALADMRAMPVAASTADGLWASASFLHVPRADAPLTLAEFWRVLKPGGALFLALKGGEGERLGNPLDGLPRYFTFWAEDDLDRVLRSTGFDIVAAWTDAPEARETRADPWLVRFATKVQSSIGRP